MMGWMEHAASTGMVALVLSQKVDNQTGLRGSLRPASGLHILLAGLWHWGSRISPVPSPPRLQGTQLKTTNRVAIQKRTEDQSMFILLPLRGHTARIQLPNPSISCPPTHSASPQERFMQPILNTDISNFYDTDSQLKLSFFFLIVFE